MKTIKNAKQKLNEVARKHPIAAYVITYTTAAVAGQLIATAAVKKIQEHHNIETV